MLIEAPSTPAREGREDIPTTTLDRDGGSAESATLEGGASVSRVSAGVPSPAHRQDGWHSAFRPPSAGCAGLHRENCPEVGVPSPSRQQAGRRAPTGTTDRRFLLRPRLFPVAESELHHQEGRLRRQVGYRTAAPGVAGPRGVAEDHRKPGCGRGLPGPAPPSCGSGGLLWARRPTALPNESLCAGNIPKQKGESEGPALPRAVVAGPDELPTRMRLRPRSPAALVRHR